MILSETSKFKLFYFIRFFGDAFFYPFMTIYFLHKGLTEDKLGILLAITPITTILVNPLWNYLVKDAKISRIVLQLMTIIEGIIIILVTRVNGFELIALLIGLIAFFCSPYVSIQDGFTATFCNKNGIEYSSIRIYASIAYVIATLIAGYLSQYFGYEVMFLTAGFFFALTAIITIWIRPIDSVKNQTDIEIPKRDFKSLIKNKNFYKYLVFYTLVLGAVRIGDSFFGMFITGNLGLSNVGYGWVYSAFVLVEVIALRYMTMKGNQFSEKKLIVFASITFIVRFLIYFLNVPLFVIIAATLLRGLGWGIVLYVHIKYVLAIVKVQNVTTAILIITLVFSIFIGIGNFVTGHFVKAFGYQWLYFILTCLITLGLVIFLIFTPKLQSLNLETRK
jgi:predicted MFS family arabinose efflux permease